LSNPDNQIARSRQISDSNTKEMADPSMEGVLPPCFFLPAFDPNNWYDIEAAFSDYASLELTQHWRKKPQAEFLPGRVQVGWRENMLWIYATLQDADIFNPAARLNEETYKLGDAFEIFLRDKRMPHYLELHVSPFNQQMQLWFPCARNPQNEKEWIGRFIEASLFQSRTQVLESENRWHVLACVPFEHLAKKETIEPGVEWLFSFSRYDYTRGKMQPVLSSTSVHRVLDFHRQEDWRTLRFSDGG